MCSRSLRVKAKTITFNDISDFIVNYPVHHLSFPSHTAFVAFPQIHSALFVVGPLHSFFPMPERLFMHLQDPLPYFPSLLKFYPLDESDSDHLN